MILYGELIWFLCLFFLIKRDNFRLEDHRGSCDRVSEESA